MSEKIKIEDMFKNLKQECDIINLDFIGKVAQEHKVSVQFTWRADGEIELYVYPQEWLKGVQK